jgi:radical SAM superfamily enzyme YgiQ (UPF0313 family)
MSLAKNEIIEKLSTLKPHLVGLTCSTFNRSFVREMIRLIKIVDHDIKVVVGGVHASFCYDQILQQSGADAVVIGEGELTLVDFCRAIENKVSLQTVNGLAFKENGQTVCNPPREIIKNLDDLAMPDYSYARSYIERSGMGFMITSRGCPVRCTFCSTSSFWGQKVRMNSVSRVVDEMEMLISRFNVQKIFFHDDTFNLGITRVKDICSEILRREIKVVWGCSCRVSPVSEEMLAAMVAAGCRHICWGIESGSESMLKRIEKKITLSQIRNAYDLSMKFRDVMSIGAFTMVGNPGESEHTVKETVSFLNSILITDRPSTSVLYILPGTLLYEGLKREGHISDMDWSRYDTVPYYTIENSFRKLAKWAMQINESGNRIPFNPEKHFWNALLKTSDLKGEHCPDSGMIRVAKTLSNPKKLLSILKSFLPAGKIRF